MEREHLRQPTDDTHELSEIDAAIIAMKEAEPEISNYEIAKRLEINNMKVKRVLDRNGY